MPDIHAVDVEGAVQRMGGDRELYRDIVQAYLQELAAQPDLLEAMVQQDDWPGAARLLHTLKGLSATVGASYMEAIARQGEATVKALMQQGPGGSHDTAQGQRHAALCATFRQAAAATGQVLGEVS